MKHGVRNEPLHGRPGKVQPPEDSVQRNAGKRLPRAQEDIDDAGVRAHAENDEALPSHVHRHVALVHDQGIRLPWLLDGPSAEMIRAALLEARHSRDLAAEVEAVVEEQPWITVVDYLRAVRRERLQRRYALKWRDLTGGQARTAIQEHAGIHVAWHFAARVARHMIEGLQQRAHMIPVAVRDGDGFHVCQRHSKVLAVSEKERPLGPGIEEQLGGAIAYRGSQDERQTELRAAQRTSRQLLGAGRHDVVELRRDVWGLARVAVAQIVERNVDDEAVDRSQIRHALSPSQELAVCSVGTRRAV